MDYLKRFFSSRWAVIPLLLVALWIYFPPYADMFVGDDYVQFGYVAQFMERPLTVLGLFNPYALSWYYRPLQNIWFLVNRLVLGVQNPIGYYYILLTFHLLTIALAYRVGRQLGVRPFWAFCLATLFGLAGHHADTVGWISSVAIVLMTSFTFATVSAYLAYRKRPSSSPLLLLTVGFFLLTLVTHEEAILIPPVLLAIVFLRADFKPKEWRKQLPSLFSPAEVAVFAGMFALITLYIYFQATRPNLTISLGETPANHWLTALSPMSISNYIIHLMARFLFAADLVTWATKPIAVAFVMVSLLVIWFWEGGRLIKLGLFWLGLHLAFIYFALWTQKPELLAGRHIYNATFGLELAFVAGLPSLTSRLKEPLRQTVAITVLALVLISHISAIYEVHDRWFEFTREDQAARTQIKQLLPTVDENTHVFAYRFPITPSFLHDVIEIWYDDKIADLSGPLDALQKYGQADPNYYVFDYENGRLYNLMPELQESAQTHLIWNMLPTATTGPIGSDRVAAHLSEPPKATIAGPADDRRIAVPATPPSENEWFSLIYTVTVPADSDLQFAIYQGDTATAQPLVFTVWLTPENGEPVQLDSRNGETAVWLNTSLPMSAYAGQTVALRFELQGDPTLTGYWGSTRFTSP